MIEEFDQVLYSNMRVLEPNKRDTERKAKEAICSMQEVSGVMIKESRCLQ